MPITTRVTGDVSNDPVAVDMIQIVINDRGSLDYPVTVSIYTSQLRAMS